MKRKRQSQAKPVEDAQRDDFDGAWKEVIERYLREFMDYFFPEASAGIDWSRPVRFLDKELQKLTPRALVRKGVVDKLFEAYTNDGAACLIAVHLEAQNEPIENLEERVFEYHYRIYERLKRPVASLVLLTDRSKDWRPHKFERVTLGCKISLEFPMAKLMDFATPDTVKKLNPFSIIVRAHRHAQASQRKPQKRFDLRMALKAEVAEAVNQIDDPAERKQAIEYWEGTVRFIERVMRLPEKLEIKFADEFNSHYGETAMEFMTFSEKKGYTKGVAEGEIKGEIKGEVKGEIKSVIGVLNTRFGEIPHRLKDAVARIDDSTKLSELLTLAVTCLSVDEFERAIPHSN